MSSRQPKENAGWPSATTWSATLGPDRIRRFLNNDVRHIFPEQGDRPAGTGFMELTEVTDQQDISEAKLAKAARKTPIRKAPGRDGVRGLAIKDAVLNASDLLRRTFNACL